MAIGVALGVAVSLVIIDARPAGADDAIDGSVDAVLVSQDTDDQTPRIGTWSLGTDRPLPRIPIELSEEVITTALAIAADLDDDLAAQLTRLRARDPAAFERQLLRSRRLLALAETKLKQPDLYDLKLYELTQDAKIVRMARELREQYANEGSSAATLILENELRKELFVQLALSHRSRRDYLDCLEGLIQRVQEEIEHESNNAAEIVEERLRDLIGPMASETSAGLSAPYGPPGRHSLSTSGRGS